MRQSHKDGTVTVFTVIYLILIGTILLFGSITAATYQLNATEETTK